MTRILLLDRRGAEKQDKSCHWRGNAGIISEVAIRPSVTGKLSKMVDSEWVVLLAKVKVIIGERLQPCFLYELKKRSPKNDRWRAATALSHGPGTDWVSSHFELGQSVPASPDSAGRFRSGVVKVLKEAYRVGNLLARTRRCGTVRLLALDLGAQPDRYELQNYGTSGHKACLWWIW